MSELSKRLRDYADSVATFAPQIAIDLFTEAADALEAAEQPESDPVANIDLAWHPCNPSTDELRKAFEEVKKLTSAVSRLGYDLARKRGVKPMNELIKRLRDVGNTFKTDYATATLADDAADALTAADTRHDDDQRAHALLEQVIVRRDAEIKRLRKIEDASAGVMLNLELARAEVRRLLVQLKGEVAELLERIRLKDGALAVAIAHLALNDGGEE